MVIAWTYSGRFTRFSQIESAGRVNETRSPIWRHQKKQRAIRELGSHGLHPVTSIKIEILAKGLLTILTDRSILSRLRRPAAWLRPRAKARSQRFCRPAP